MEVQHHYIIMTLKNYQNNHLMQITDMKLKVLQMMTLETTLTVTDPTADRTITLPDATGQVVLSRYIDTDASAETGVKSCWLCG